MFSLKILFIFSIITPILSSVIKYLRSSNGTFPTSKQKSYVSFSPTQLCFTNAGTSQ